MFCNCETNLIFSFFSEKEYHVKRGWKLSLKTWGLWNVNPNLAHDSLKWKNILKIFMKNQTCRNREKGSSSIMWPPFNNGPQNSVLASVFKIFQYGEKVKRKFLKLIPRVSCGRLCSLMIVFFISSCYNF